MALSESAETGRLVDRLIQPLRDWMADGSDRSRAQRAAGTAFLIRVASAALVYFAQVLLARWMGSFEFGVYVYVWTWVLLLGGVIDFGLASSAQRFIPEYTGWIAIHALREGEELVLQIRDSGDGLPPDRLMALNRGVGLDNTR